MSWLQYNSKWLYLYLKFQTNKYTDRSVNSFKGGRYNMSKQSEAPLFSKLIEHIDQHPIPFHIPGHKQGNGVDPAFREFVGKNAFLIDLINIAPLDNLHHPNQVIKQAQDLAAKAFRADHSFFSVQGTSTAIIAMLLSVCSPGDKIILPRNIHKSVLSAIILADAIPIFLQPEIDQKIAITHNITTAQVKSAIQTHPDSKAVLMIHPTYYGVAGNLEEIVSLAHQHQMVVLVDEAHGVLQSFHEDLPISSMDAGADMAATSVHKLGGSLTQSSILNLKGERIHSQKVQTIFNMLTTTSTSYLLLASLDTQRRHLALNGRRLIDRTLTLAKNARSQINQIPGLYCPGEELFSYESVHALDPTKLIIHLDQLNISGQAAETWLREHHQIEVELSDFGNLLCFITIGDHEESIQKLLSALQDLSATFYQKKAKAFKPIHLPRIPELTMTPREAFYHQSITTLPLEKTVNMICAEPITVYPPGIPVLLPGERISREHIEYIQENLTQNALVLGVSDARAQMVRVIP